MDILRSKSMDTGVSSDKGWCDVSRKGKFLKVVCAVVILLILYCILSFFGWLPFSSFPAYGSSDWQAVFLTNSQVYFGHLRNYSRGYAVIRDIYYLRVAEPLQQGAQPPGPTLNLVKLGSELHGPQDAMFVPKDKIVFWENLRKDSQVVQSINGFLASQPKR